MEIYIKIVIGGIIGLLLTSFYYNIIGNYGTISKWYKIKKHRIKTIFSEKIQPGDSVRCLGIHHKFWKSLDFKVLEVHKEYLILEHQKIRAYKFDFILIDKPKYKFCLFEFSSNARPITELKGFKLRWRNYHNTQFVDKAHSKLRAEGKTIIYGLNPDIKYRYVFTEDIVAFLKGMKTKHTEVEIIKQQ